MLLAPVPKEIIWGGEKLKTEYGKKAPFDKIAESWELSVREKEMCVIANGEYTGMPLGEYLAEDKSGLIGKNGEKYDRFPLLIKFIDAADRLSIQVHPDNAYALEHEGELGKTEMWYVVAANDGAQLVYGLRDGYSIEDFARSVDEDRTEDALNFTPVHPGDVFFIPSGQVHAIGAGIVIAEIQQNSDVTYRVYDYKRRGADGNYRQLHTARAIDVIKLRSREEIDAIRFSKKCDDGGEVLASCDYFTTRRYSVGGELTLEAGSDSFVSVLVLEAENCVLTCGADRLTVNKGDSVFVPAGCGRFLISGNAEIIVSSIN